MNSDRMQRKTARKKKAHKYPWVVQNPNMELKMDWDEPSEEEGMQRTTREVQGLELQTDDEQVAEVEVQQEEESELARVARQIRVRMEREEREAQVRYWPMTQQTEQPLQLDGMRPTPVPHRPFLTIEQCFNWPDELLVPTKNQQLSFNNWDSDSESLEPQPRVVYDSIALFPLRRCLLTDCTGFQASSTNNSRKAVPSLECPPGVEQFEPKAVDPITMLADSNLLNHYLSQCLRCEIKQHTRQIQQQQQQRDAIEQSSSDVIISNPNGSFAFALKDGCNSRLIWPADCLCLVCPAANAQQFSLSTGNAQEENPQVRRLSDWERLAICHKLSLAPGSLLMQFSDAATLNAYSKVFSFLAPAPLELFSGNKHFGADDVRLFWHMRWVSQPVAIGDSDHEATVQLSDGRFANWAIRVLAANGLIAARRTRKDPSNQPEISRKIFIVQGIPMSLSTNPLFSHYVETILMANSIGVESVVLDRDGGHYYSVPISRELGKIKRKLFQESREIRVHLSPDLVHPNVDPNDLEQVAQFFENPHVHFPFEVKKGWTYWLQEDGGRRRWFDATGIPIEPKHDSTAELEWKDQQLAERFTDHFARLTPNPLKWRMRRRDNMGVRLTFGYRTTLFISKTVRIACDAQLRQLDKDLRLLHYPEDLPQLRDALTERERYWAQLVDMRSRQQPFETHNQDCPVQLIVEGYPRALFEEALNEVKQILAGVPFDCSDMEREGRLMHGIGLRWLKAELEKEENRCVAMDVNALRRTITFWGETEQVNQLINEAVHFANHSESYYIDKSIVMTPPNYPANFRSIIEGIGFQELREITGGAQFSTDDTDENGWETLIFRGSIAQFGRLEAFLQVMLRELPPAVGVSTTFSYVQNCPVCFTPVTKSTGLTLTSCSHSYCLDCFINMVANKVQSRDLNFTCLKENCNRPIAIKHIMRVVVGPPSRIKSLDAAKLEPLLRALKDSIACGDTDTMRVCPTPDCFGLIPVPKEGFPTHKIRCDECGKKRCSGRNCMQPPHKGLTCEVAERIRGDADESLRVYGDRIGQDRLKKCPSCTMVIEKQLGCNHMECAKCKIHFCWLCGFQSKERSELYRHLGDTHQGYGGGFQIQGDQLVQINGEEEAIDLVNFVIPLDMGEIEAGPWNVGIW